jgi:pimeloyl-ACP methyl ester carboxylesterase
VEDPAQDNYVTLRGLRFHYRSYSIPPDSARAIVLLHGVASNAKIWITTAPLLARRYVVMALDQRGHGLTDKPDSGYDFSSVVEDVAAFVDEHALERPVIVGHSWGGNVALQYAARYPERPAGIVLVDGGFMEMSARPGMTWERAERELAPPDMTRMTPNDLVDLAKRWELGPMWTDAVEEALLANFEVTEAGTIRPHMRRENHMQVVRALWEQRPSSLAGDVRCRVLYVLAERAAEGRAREWMEHKRDAIDRLQGAFAHCQVRWMPDTIHDIPLQRPTELAQTIEDFVETLET